MPTKNMYDFTTPIDRAHTGSIKVDMAPEPIKGAGLVPLTIADQEFAVAPEIRAAIKKAADHGIYGYTYADEEYRSAVDAWMLRRHSWNTANWTMFPTPGVVAALGLAVRAFTDIDDGIIIQPPVYPPFASAIKNNNRQLIENPLIYKNGRYEMDFDDLEKKASRKDVKMIILCSPHNPVGRVWMYEELQRLGDICKRNDVFILCDEIHNDLILPGNRHTVFANIPGMEDNCMICTAVSKTFSLAGLCCSNIFVKNSEAAQTFKATIRRDCRAHIPYFSRAATIAAYNEAEGWLDELLNVVQGNFELLYDYLDRELPMLHAIRTEGTYLAWLDMRGLGLNDDELEALMLKNYLALDEGFIFGSGGSGFERWNLALPRQLLEAALHRLKNAVDTAEKKC